MREGEQRLPQQRGVPAWPAANSRVYRYNSLQSYSKPLKLPKCKDRIFIVFTDIPESELESLEQPRYLDYNRDAETLIIPVSSDPHETPASYIKRLVLGKPGEMQLKGAIGPGRSTRKKGKHRENEPSVSIYLLRFARPAGRTAKWLTLAIEVGVSEAAEKLELDIAFWFSKPEGDVRVGITIHY